MKLRLPLLTPSFWGASKILLAQLPAYNPTTEGIITITDPFLPAAPKTLRPEIISDRERSIMVRWTLSPQNKTVIANTFLISTEITTACREKIIPNDGRKG